MHDISRSTLCSRFLTGNAGPRPDLWRFAWAVSRPAVALRGLRLSREQGEFGRAFRSEGDADGEAFLVGGGGHAGRAASMLRMLGEPIGEHVWTSERGCHRKLEFP